MLRAFIGWYRGSQCIVQAPGGRRRRRQAAVGSRPSPFRTAVVESLEPRMALSANPVTSPVGFDAVPANTGSGYSVTMGGSVANAINFRGDHDWYRVSLVAGTRYQFNLNATANSLLIPAVYDTVLTLRNGSGSVLVTNDDGAGVGRNSQIVFNAPSTGTYFLDVSSYADKYTGGYTLTTRSLGLADDYAAGTGTSGSVAVNGSVTGVVNSAGDRDWFRVYLTGGRTYRFDLTQGTLRDPYLVLRNGSGTQLTQDDDGGGGYNSRITYRPTTSGWFYLDAGGYGSVTGSFTLRVTRL